MKNKFCILNEFDAPCPGNIAVETRKGFKYIHPDLSDFGLIEDSGVGKHLTPVHEFGIELTISGKTVTGKRVGESTAQYSDGAPRRWQGEEDFSFEANL